jgi:hypothetical protein
LGGDFWWLYGFFLQLRCYISNIADSSFVAAWIFKKK